MRVLGPVLLLVACASPPADGERPPVTEGLDAPNADLGPMDVDAPVAPPGGLRSPVLHPPFEGEPQTSNPFDHSVRAAPPGPGLVLDHRGERSLGTRHHRAWDFMVPFGEPVLAPADGIVQSAGPVRSFWCDALERQVSDQLAVVIQHVVDGRVYETELHHLARVDVAAGDEVARGQVLGASGNSGCSTGAHLHFEVHAVRPDRRAPVDPFGWQGRGVDPWSTVRGGDVSPWLWDEAPRVRFEASRPADAVDDAAPVYVSRVRYRGWNDRAHPNNEFVEVRLDPRVSEAETVDVAGWRLRLAGGPTFTFPDGSVLRRGVPTRVYVGGGLASDADHRWGLDQPVLPDVGGMIDLLDAEGSPVHRFTWGRAEPAAREAPLDEPPSCPDASLGCLPLPVGGDVRALAWSPSGSRLALVVGARRRLVTVAWEDGAPVAQALERIAGGQGAPEDVGGVGWLGDEVVVFDAPGWSESRGLWTAVPGGAAAPLFAPREGVSDTLVDVHRGRLLYRHEDRGDATLQAWWVGREVPAVVAKLGEARLSARWDPSARRVAWAHGDRVHVAVPEAAREEPRSLGASVDAVIWRDDGVRALVDGRLMGPDGPEGPEALVRLDDGRGIAPVVVDAQGRAWRGADAPLEVPDGVRRVASHGARVAVVAPFAPGFPAGVGIVTP